MSDRPTTVLFDVRCLQDPGYRHRGIGQHAACIIAGARTELGQPAPRVIGILDPHLPELLEEFVSLFDELRFNPYPAGLSQPYDSSRTWFVQLSPLTHTQTRFAGLLARSNIFKAAIFYDDIPAERPNDYLSRSEVRVEYIANIAWLMKYDQVTSISAHAQARLSQLLGMTPAGKVSGVAVRPRLLPNVPPLSRSERGHILVSSGADRRKNALIAVQAFTQSAIPSQSTVVLHLFGSTPAEMAVQMRSLLTEAQIPTERLIISEHLSDESLCDLYRTALLLVVPSQTEGFSIPVIEANAAATPVLLSNIGAHLELISHPDAVFDANDVQELRTKMEGIILSGARWHAMQDIQRDVWRRFEPKVVAQRFWDGLQEAASKRDPQKPAFQRGAKPRIAFVSPMPPTVSGIADYSSRCLADLSHHADVHVYTDTPAARITKQNYSSLQPISTKAFVSSNYDGVISVMGNSHYHLKTFQLMADYGGACVSHDVRMLDFYVHLFGLEKARMVAEREQRTRVSTEDVRGWLADPGTLPVPLLSEIREQSEPFFVHSPITAQLLETIGCNPPIILPFAVMRDVDLSLLREANRVRVRERLGYGPGEIVITSFGLLTTDKALAVVIWSAEALVSWGYNIRLVFCGSGPKSQLDHLAWLAKETGLGGRLTLFETSPSHEQFHDHLIASDAGIQLRTYYLGSISAAVSECICAALPTVANAHLADAIQAPAFIRRTPDNLSPLLIAEQLASIIDSRLPRTKLMDEVNHYRSTHSFHEYNKILMSSMLEKF